MKYKKSAESTAQIIAAAMRVLARQGYARTSLMDIAKEAGMSKGAVHYHYPSKEELITTVLQTACNAVAERTRQAWTRGKDPLDALHSALVELWDVRARRTDEMAVVADLIAQSLYDEALRRPLSDYYTFALGQVQEHLKQHVAGLGIELQAPPERIARTLLALLDGLAMQHAVDPEAVTADDAVETVALVAASFAQMPMPPLRSERVPQPG